MDIKFKTPKEPIFQASFRPTTQTKLPKLMLTDIKHNLQQKKQFQEDFQGSEEDRCLLQTVIEMEEQEVHKLTIDTQKELDQISKDLEHKQQLLNVLQSHCYLPQVIDLEHRIQELQITKQHYQDSL